MARRCQPRQIIGSIGPSDHRTHRTIGSSRHIGRRFETGLAPVGRSESRCRKPGRPGRACLGRAAGIRPARGRAGLPLRSKGRGTGAVPHRHSRARIQSIPVCICGCARPNAMLRKCPAGRFFPASQPPPAATGAHKDNNDLQNVSLRDGDLRARPRWPGCATRGAQPMTAGIGEPMCKIAAAGAEHARIAPTDRTGFGPTRALASSCRVTAAIHDGTTRRRSRPGQQGDRGCAAAGSRHGAAVHGTGPAAPRKLVRTRGKSGAQRGPALFTLTILPTGGIRWKNFC